MFALILSAALHSAAPAPPPPRSQSATNCYSPRQLAGGAPQPVPAVPCKQPKPFLMAAPSDAGPRQWRPSPGAMPWLAAGRSWAAGCAPVTQMVSDDRQARARKLGQLPRGTLQYAVVRSIDGCPVAAPMGYHPGYLLPGAADATVTDTQFTPEGAPADRR